MRVSSGQFGSTPAASCTSAGLTVLVPQNVIFLDSLALMYAANRLNSWNSARSTALAFHFCWISLVRDHLDLHGLVLKIASVRIRTRRKPELGELARGLEEIPPHGPCHHRRPSILKLLENLIRQHVDDAIFRGPKSVRLRCQARGTRTNSGVNRGWEEPPKRMWLLERACTEWKTQQHL